MKRANVSQKKEKNKIEETEISSREVESGQEELTKNSSPKKEPEPKAKDAETEHEEENETETLSQEVKSELEELIKNNIQGKNSEEEAKDAETEHDTEDENEASQEKDFDSVKCTPEYQALNDKHLRLYAEFENFRRRTSRETLEVMQRANTELLEKLIPTLENLTRAFSPEHKAKKLEDFEAGIKMIFNEFKDVLDEAGLEEIDPEGEPFDPNFHEALLQQNHDTVEEDSVIQVFEKGYKVKSKILKPAKVIVSKGPEEK